MQKFQNFRCYLFIIILFTFSNNFAQTSIIKEETSTPIKLLNGLTSSLSYVDAPLYLTFLFRNELNKSFIANKILFTPFDFEKGFNRSSTADEISSIGSINKDIIPGIILGGGFVTTLSLDLFSESKITSRDYRRFFMFYKTLIYTYTLTEIVKTAVKKQRPNKKDYRSFFSGHSSTTFAAVHFMYKELLYIFNKTDFANENVRDILKASAFIVSYGWASIVAFSRLRDNQHYLTDVLIGAGAGLLISELLHNAFMSDNDPDNSLKFVITPNQIRINLTF